jgi:hypothetical protein
MTFLKPIAQALLFTAGTVAMVAISAYFLIETGSKRLIRWAIKP